MFHFDMVIEICRHHVQVVKYLNLVSVMPCTFARFYHIHDNLIKNKLNMLFNKKILVDV